MNTLSNVIKAYNKLNTIQDLQDNNLTLADFRLFESLIKELSVNKYCKCISENVAQLFLKNRCKVTKNINSVYYIVKL